MTIISRYDGKCKDCGTPYLAGENIDTNGNKSPNKTGEMKDHWCKNGKNCQGAMTLKTSSATTTGNDLPKGKDPTPEQYLELGSKLIDICYRGSADDRDKFIKGLIGNVTMDLAKLLIKRSVIEETMNELGLQHPSRIAFIKDVLR